MEFIKKIIENKIDEEVHRMFIRFSKGTFENRALLSIKMGKDKINVRSSYDIWPELFSILLKEVNEVEVTGRLFKSRKKEDYSEKISSNDLMTKIKYYDFALLDVNAGGYVLKCKKALPKPGKSLDVKFCAAILPLKALDILAFDFDKNFKKAEVSHTFIITEIILPEGEEDSAILRIKSKRKGKIIRKINLDGVESVKEIEFIA
ncbi:hypothetical protein HY498_01225 [Candidatus Woesearchaeota archaeon]|nr:hypothetical protein [Candidatus Woesearchaeota archaeon]